MHLILLIRALSYGGAQRQIITLANGLARRGHDVTLVVFYSQNPLVSFLDDRVKLISMNKRNRWDLAGFLSRLICFIRSERPDLVYSFMEASNIISICLKLFSPKLKVIWGIRRSMRDLNYYDWTARATEAVERFLSVYVNIFIFNSTAGMRMMVRKGYPASRSCVVPNGIETNYFIPNAYARIDKRREWGISPRDHLIGIVGRLDPMKDHVTFLKAATQLIKLNPHTRFVCVGDGPFTYKQNLQRLCSSLNIAERILWVGNQQNMPSVYNALDVLVSSSSFGEGFSNVLGEAMASGVPCIVTDVGDSAEIVGETGLVVPPRDPQALARAMEEMVLRLDKVDRQLLRSRIQNKFSVEALIKRTEGILLELLI